MPEIIKEETARMNGDICSGGISGIQPKEWEILREQKNCRYGYTLFGPLAGETEIGTAALLMNEQDPEASALLLDSVKRFEELPIQALCQALNRGVVFPLPTRSMNIEELDILASRMTQDQTVLRTLVERSSQENFSGSWQSLLWARGLALSAVRSCEWKDAKNDFMLAKAFSKVEWTFLTAYYAPEVLREENLCALPFLHRFGWYCAHAFDALEAGDTVGYVHYLREGLVSCEAMKEMVEFLLKYTPELQPLHPNAELLVLAEKVRTILAAYPSDDPAVILVKQSAAYQKMSHLFKEQDLALAGGLTQ